VIALLGAALAAEPADDPAPAAAWQRSGWGWGGLPAVNFNSDEGFGFGVVGSIYRYDARTNPYRTAVNLVIFATSKGIQTHSLELDALELGQKPLRFTSRIEFATTRTSNYCGVGPAVTCSDFFAEQAADQEGLSGAAREEYERVYYRTRFINPNGQFNLRWALDPLPHRLELFTSYRVNVLVPGDFSTATAYPGSLYDQDFPGGEQGVVSQVQLGIMLDDRDYEPAPTRGYWIEGSVRGAHGVIGSDYDHFGFNTTLRGYVPLGTDDLVFAERVVFDGLVGDTHAVDLAMPGGFQRYVFYGSLNAGRGIRLRRYLGKVKALQQAELRWTPWRPKVGSTKLAVGVLGFSDLGFVAEDFQRIDTMFSTPLPTVGGGLRVGVDGAFVVRADVGVSPIEDWAPSLYIDLRNTF
jgi:hypothetical protein